MSVGAIGAEILSSLKHPMALGVNREAFLQICKKRILKLES